MLPKTYRKLTAVREGRNLRDVVDILEEPLPAPAPQQLLVRNLFVGINAADYMMAIGEYISRTPRPFDMGGESVGEVVAVGAAVEGISVGDHVLTLGGGFREYYLFDAAQALPIPQASAELVSLGVGGLTASIALDVTGQMSSGETVLVTAAAGGTGTFAVQLAKLAGNHVIGTCSSDDKVEFLRRLGCDRPINYKQEDLREVLKAEYRKGIDIVFDGVGGDQFDIAVSRLAVGGRLLVIGAISEYKTGPQAITAPRIGFQLIGKSASVRGFWLMHFFRKYGVEHLQKLMALVHEGKLDPQVDPQVFTGVDQVVDAIEYLYTGANTGKVVVRF